MINKKYANDYRLENEEKNGKIKTVAVYKGDYYCFEDSEKAAESAKTMIILIAVGIVAYAAGLLMNTSLLRQMYIAFPYIICSLPLIYLAIGVYYTFRSEKKFTRERNDKMHDRVAKCSLIVIIFSGMALAGSGVAYAAGAAVADIGGIIFMICDAVVLGCVLRIFIIKTPIKGKIC